MSDIKTKPITKAYAEGWERTFGKRARYLQIVPNEVPERPLPGPFKEAPDLERDSDA